MNKDPKLAFYIEEYNQAGKELARIASQMDKWRRFAKRDYEVDIANDRSIN